MQSFVRAAVVVFLISICSVAFAQTSGAILPDLPPVFTGPGAGPAANAKLCWLAAGTTSTWATVYSDSALASPLPNPTTLSALGIPQTEGGASTQIYLSPSGAAGGGNYKAILYAAGTGSTCNGTTVGAVIWTRDNVYDAMSIYPNSFATKLDDKVCHPSKMSGTTPNDMSGKAVACIAALPSTGGTIDLQGLEGAQALSANVFNGVTKPLTLLFGASTISITAAQQMSSNVSIKCRGTVFNVASDLPNISELGSASAAFYAKSGASNVSVEWCNFTGPYSGTGTSGTTFGLYAGSSTANVRFSDNSVCNFSWSGIHFFTGTGLLADGNHTCHNAIDGIESWATDSQIVNNYSSDDAAASANGTACIEIIGRQVTPAVATSDGTIVSHNQCISSNAAGIQLSTVGSGATKDVAVRGNYISSPASIAINVQGGHVGFSIDNNIVNTTRGSGAFGRGISLANCTNFSVTNNKLSHLTVGSGPNAIEVGGSCENGIVKANTIDDAWVGINISGTAATNNQIVTEGNVTTNISSGLPYAVTTSGTKATQQCNAFTTTVALDCPLQLTGTTTNDNAASGVVGEYASSTVAVGASISLASASSSTVTSINLTAGDWDVTGEVDYTFAGGTSFTIVQQGISTTANTLPARGALTIFETPAEVPTAATDPAWVTPVVRISLGSPATVYLVTQATFTVSTLKAYGSIRARRVR